METAGDRLVHQLCGMSEQALAMAASFKVITTCLQEIVSACPDASASAAANSLLSFSASLSSTMDGASRSLHECMCDLQSMSEAMLPVMASNPEAAPALTINLYSSFARQLRDYYSELRTAFAVQGEAFEKGKAALSKDAHMLRSASHQASTNDAGSPSALRLLSSSTTMQNAERQASHSIASGTTEVELNSNSGSKYGSAATAVGRKKSEQQEKKTDTLKEKRANNNLKVDTSDNAKTSEHISFSSDPLSGVPPGGPNQVELEGIFAAAEAGSPLRTPATRTLSRATTTTAVFPSSAVLHPELEPTPLHVTGTIEEALGELVLATRPNAFSSVELITRRAPLTSYYVSLVRPGSLAHFISRNYINADEDAQADLLCDVLDTDCVEEEPFASVNGEVRVTEAQEAEGGDLSHLPCCAWRLTSSEDHTRNLYTAYLLAEVPRSLAATSDTSSSLSLKPLAAFIHDSFTTATGHREEVLHVVRVVDKAPQFAFVSVYVHSPSRSGMEKCATMMSFTRSMCARDGFMEVPEAEVVGVVQISQEESSRHQNDRHVTLTSPGTKSLGPFNPNVELADLSGQTPEGGYLSPPLSLGDVAKGAVRGGIGVLKAPFNAGRAAAEAIMDVTGMNGAVRNSAEQAFRRAFPDLADEEVTEFFLASWQDGSSARQGYLYVMAQVVCFCGGGGSFVLEYDEVKDIQKAKVAKVFDTAIDMSTHVGEHFVVGNLVQRDQVFSLLMQYWLKQ